MAANPKHFQDWRMQMTVEEYLQLDDSSIDVRYEYIDGRVYAMAGGSKAHSKLKQTVARDLEDRLSGSPCDVFDTDVRVQLSKTRYLYPDVTISCDPIDVEEEEDKTILFPRVVVEVLSPSNKSSDWTEKLMYYQQCPT